MSHPSSDILSPTHIKRRSDERLSLSLDSGTKPPRIEAFGGMFPDTQTKLTREVDEVLDNAFTDGMMSYATSGHHNG
jgi:hypothetical protein